MAKKDTVTSNQYSEEEIKRRFEAALRGAREVGHEQMKDIPSKRAKIHSEMKIGKRKAKASQKRSNEPSAASYKGASGTKK